MKPTMLVPFDFSENATQALAWAAELQRTSGAGPIRMVHAISSVPMLGVETAVPLYIPDEEAAVALERMMLEAAARHEAKAVAQVLIAGRPVGEIILDAARDAHAELIVMGTQGRSGMKRLMFGSVADHVVRHARCPVVTVRGPR